MTPSDMSHAQYGLFFDVRRSMRYHDRRRAFFEQLHQVTGVLTVLLAGSVIFDIARPGDSPVWLLALSTLAAVLSAIDIMVGYASRAALHLTLKQRFGQLEMNILSGDDASPTWQHHRQTRLAIEQDEPPIYRALDLLCYNELLRAEGNEEAPPSRVGWWQQFTRHLFHWADLKAT